MIHVKVIKAENLPDTKKKVRKTKVYCFSSSSRRYYLDKYKSKEKKNPKWKGEFDIYLFRASNLSFTIFSSRMLAKKVFIGRVDIDVCNLLSNDIGKQILSHPNSYVEQKFPIKLCNSQNATITLSFSYSPSVYQQIEFKDISKPTIHFWATYDPPLKLTEDEQIPVEIELLQATAIKDRKIGETNVFYTNLNKETVWDAIGCNSNSIVFPSSTGYTQVHTFKLSRIADKYEFFILNVFNYKGTVTINFIEEKRGKNKKFKDGYFFTIKSGKDNIGTVKSVSLKVEENKKYCAPFFMFYDKKFSVKTMNFVDFPMICYDKDKSVVDSDSVDYSDSVSKRIPFLSEIIEEARKSISEFKDVNFMRVNALPDTEIVSISKTIRDYNVPVTNNIRIYISGLAIDSQSQDQNKQQPSVNYWDPFFVVYDTKTGQKCKEIADKLVTNPIKESSFPAGKDFMGIKAHTTLTLNLDKIERDKIVVFGIHCKSYLNDTKQEGFFMISHVGPEQETLLFKEPVFADDKTHDAVFFRFLYQYNEWEIAPIRHFFTDEKQAYTFLDNLKANNWVMQNNLLSQNNKSIVYEDSDSN